MDATTNPVLRQLPRHVRLAYEHGRTAYVRGWTVCLYAPPRLMHAWYSGYSDEGMKDC
jgi:hypothetical protein